MFSKFFNYRNLHSLVQKNKRFFDLHEYQSMGLMQKYGVNVPQFNIAQTPEDAKKIADGLPSDCGLVVKAQVHAGGRGKGKLSSGLQGGVHVVKTSAQIQDLAKQMLGFNLSTKQTTGDGLRVDAVLVAEGLKLKKEMYLAFILDRASQRPAIIASKFGGMNIEEVAEKDPDAIILQTIDPKIGIQDSDVANVINKLELQSCENAGAQLKAMFNMFTSIDATQVEINPWAVSEQGKAVTVDAKVNIDDSAKYRQKEICEMRANSVCAEDKDPHEEMAHEAGLAYVPLDGSIGCLVNGAGLAMATMDTIKLYGGWPANFMDAGGGADEKQVRTAFNILLGHPNVKAILVNIFGGIVDCKMIATAVTNVANDIKLPVPLVIRLAGNNAEAGLKLIEAYIKANPNEKVQVASDMGEAAKLAAESIK